MEIRWAVFPNFWRSTISMKRPRLKRNQAVFFIIVLSIIICGLIFILRPEKILTIDEQIAEMLQSNFFEESTDGGCKFPKLNPHSALAKKYDKDVPKVICNGVDWVECNISQCQVKQSILDSMRDVMCYYKDIVYIDDYHYGISEATMVLDDQKYLLNQSDYFKVSCFGYDKTGFSLFAKRWHGYKSGVRPVIPPPSPPGREDSINVLIVGFDSASHNGFLRKMPRSYKTLKHELEAVILKGYNILGDGTAAALLPILSGRTEYEHHPFARRKYSSKTFLDSDLFIFNTLKQDGYRTAYYEDMPWIGTFQYRYNGFTRKPADHYLRSLLMEETKEGYKIWQGETSRYCFGEIPQYLFLLNLAKQLLQRTQIVQTDRHTKKLNWFLGRGIVQRMFMNVKSKRFCFTFIADICHDDLNQVATADDDLVDFLRDFKRSGHLNDTLLIVMGDHGPRFTPMRATYQGKIEERMAFMSIVLPEKLKKQRPDALFALKTNVDVLTTPFDIHTTLLDAMGLKRFANIFTVPNAYLTRGLSLLTPIPRSRNCEEAYIFPHWCVCLNADWTWVSRTDPIYQRVGNALAGFVNNATIEKRKLCEYRPLTSIEWVLRQENKDSTRKNGSEVYYQALIIMSPGRAAFEGSMQYFKSTDKFTISDKDVSRISSYGNEPSCVSASRPDMNKYCYCKDKLARALNFFM